MAGIVAVNIVLGLHADMGGFLAIGACIWVFFFLAECIDEHDTSFMFLSIGVILELVYVVFCLVRIFF